MGIIAIKVSWSSPLSSRWTHPERPMSSFQRAEMSAVERETSGETVDTCASPAPP